MSTSLVQLTVEVAELERQIVQAGGELTPEIETALTLQSTALEHKVDAYDVIVSRLEAMSSWWKEEAEKRSRVAKAMANAAERLRENIKYAMITTGRDEICGVDTRFYLTNNAPKLVIEDAQVIPAQYKHEVVTVELNKDAIKGALKDGLEVPGAKLEPVKSLRVGRCKK